MTDSRFSECYKESVNSTKLPENFKDNILSNLDFDEKVIPFETTQKKKPKAKSFPRTMVSAAAAVAIAFCALLLFSVFKRPMPVATTDLTVRVANATNLTRVGGAKVTFKNSKGEYLKDEKGRVLTAYTDEQGAVSATVPEGEELQVEVLATGFIPFVGNAVENIYISPEMTKDTYRAVLIWKEECDLDAFLTLTTEDGVEKLHYFKSDIVNKEGNVIAALDTDSEVPFAPETITFNASDGGLWRFSVGSYSSLKDEEGTMLRESGATVTLYKGDSLVGEYSIDTRSQGNVWCVFQVEKGKLNVCDKTYSVDAITDID